MDLREQGKIAVEYDRQVAVFGQKAADNVLNFWILGHTSRDEEFEAQRKLYEGREEVFVNRQESDQKYIAALEYFVKGVKGDLNAIHEIALSSADIHKLEYAGDAPFTCTYCKKEFEGSNELDAHLNDCAEIPDPIIGGVITEDDMEAAKGLVISMGQCSTSFLQRKLKIGYNRAVRIIQALEAGGVVGPADNSMQREVLIKKT